MSTCWIRNFIYLYSHSHEFFVRHLPFLPNVKNHFFTSTGLFIGRFSSSSPRWIRSFVFLLSHFLSGNLVYLCSVQRIISHPLNAENLFFTNTGSFIGRFSSSSTRWIRNFCLLVLLSPWKFLPNHPPPSRRLKPFFKANFLFILCVNETWTSVARSGIISVPVQCDFLIKGKIKKKKTYFCPVFFIWSILVEGLAIFLDFQEQQDVMTACYRIELIPYGRSFCFSPFGFWQKIE